MVKPQEKDAYWLFEVKKNGDSRPLQAEERLHHVMTRWVESSVESNVRFIFRKLAVSEPPEKVLLVRGTTTYPSQHKRKSSASALMGKIATLLGISQNQEMDSSDGPGQDKLRLPPADDIVKEGWLDQMTNAPSTLTIMRPRAQLPVAPASVFTGNQPVIAASPSNPPPVSPAVGARLPSNPVQMVLPQGTPQWMLCWCSISVNFIIIRAASTQESSAGTHHGPLITIPLDGCNAFSAEVHRAAETENGPPDRPKSRQSSMVSKLARKPAFIITGRTGEFVVFSASSAEERDDWITAIVNSAKLYKLKREKLGPSTKVVEAAAGPSVQEEVRRTQQSKELDGSVVPDSARDRDKNRIGIQDFDLLRVIGEGAFGKVLLCSKKSSGAVYAIKVLKKAHIKQGGADMVSRTNLENKILRNIRHPFIVQLHFAFQTAERLYLVMVKNCGT